MVFSSVDFLFLFLPVFLLVQNFLPYHNLTYVLFSLAFYFIGEGWFTAVVLLSVVFNYCLGLLVDAQSTPTRRKVAVGAGVAVNLASLFFFKYIGFFAENLFGVRHGAWITTVHLPLGISFFTFHSISYLVDIYRGDAKAERSLVNLGLYILMFPQLIAGPILRFHTIATQLERRFVDIENVYFGVFLFCLGMGQKVLIADTLAGVADPLFARSATLSPSTAWLAAVAYTFQIYFDFSGYSNMAIGLGWMSGFFFMKNFDYPYVSRSITEFWRRWHMSLSAWFRDYLYKPLGGNRSGRSRTYRNLIIVFLLCGLWHGAAWTFILWGVYQGALLVVERVGFGALLERMPAPLRHAYALLAIVVGWVLFRSDGVPHAGAMLSKMFLLRGTHDLPVIQVLSGEEIVTLFAAAAFSFPAVSRLLQRWIPMPHHPPWDSDFSAPAYVGGLTLGLTVLAASAVKILTGAYSPFIYFRF